MAAPRFSIITPVFETPPDALLSMLKSVRGQSFDNWELCVVDDGSSQSHPRAILDQARKADPRIQTRERTQNGGIVAASNEALSLAGGDFIVLLDHDDMLHPDALSLVSAAIDATPEADYIYTDEDKIDRAGLHSGAFFKPDWAPERMRTQMYTCHLSVLRRTLVEEVGGFDPDYEGSQDWDLVLKVTERSRAVIHVPRILYHWRMLESSTAGSGEAAKPWAFEAGKRAVQAHCNRTKLQAEVERDPDDPGVYHLQPALSDRPKVSIVIPTRGQVRDVRYEPVVLVGHCIRSIIERSTYDNYEIVCVYDSGTDPAVLSELELIAGDRLRLVCYGRPFNFSEKINCGAVHSEGKHLLLLNDDMEVITPDWIERLLMYSSHSEIGAVGARLLWEDGRLQHAGVQFQHGLPGHIYRGFSGSFKGYSNNAVVAQNYLAVTGACLMTPRDAFELVGGLTTTFPNNYNDMDFCLKLRAKGMRVVYDPDTVLYHFESSSRSSSDVELWEKEQLVDRWLSFTGSDPFSNPNLANGVPRLRSTLAWVKRRPRLGLLRSKIAGSRG